MKFVTFDGAPGLEQKKKQALLKFLAKQTYN
jgi:hypothetical protein